MNVINPAELTFISSSVPEDDAPLWNESTAYTSGAKVIHDHRVYTALADSTGKPPADNCTGADAVWRLVGPTNRYTCLDDYVSSQTVAPEGVTDITLSVPFNRCTGFALLNFWATTVRVTVTDIDGEVLHDVTTTPIKDVDGWWNYYFLPLEYQIDLVVTGVPISPFATLTITLTHAGGPRLGHIVAGAVWPLGATLYQAQGGQRDYSRKETSEFGETRLIPRATARRTSLPLYVHPGKVDTVHERLRALSGRPALWIGDNRDSGQGGHQHLTVYGWLEDYRSVCAGPNEISMTLDIQGLI